MFSGKNKLKVYLIILISIIIIVLCAFAGRSYDLGDSFERSVFLNLRVSRVLLGFLVGAILSLAGLCFQTIFQNYLASPFTLGVASGASLGAAVIIKFDLVFVFLGLSSVFAGAFVGALFSIFFIFFLIKYKKADRNFIMLLSGVAFNFMASSIVLLLQYIGDLSQSYRLSRWTMGSLDVVDFIPVIKTLPFFILIISIVFYYYKELDLMLFGRELAFSKGVDVEKVEIMFFIFVSLAVGSVISLCGPIGFIGLMVPHMVKRIIRIKHNYLAVTCIFFGGAFLVFCDMLSRLVLSVNQIPVGIVTSFLGAPFFLYLMFRKKN